MQHLEPQLTNYVEVEDVTVETSINRSRSPLEYQVNYHNHLNVPLTVTFRNGVPFRLPAGDGKKNCFEVFVTYEVDPNVAIDPRGVFHQHAGQAAESQALQAALESCEKSARFNRKRFTLRYSVPAQVVEKNSGVIYIADLDLVVSVCDDERHAIHPYSPSSERYRLIEAEANVNNPDSFGYALYLVSNNRTVSDKYINVGGKVYRVPSIENKSLRDGVYLCSSGTVDGRDQRPTPLTEYYSYEQAFEELHLYNDPETALRLGDQLAAREKELKELQMRLKEQEHDHKIERLELEHDLALEKQKLDRLRLEQEQRYAQEEHERKMRALRDKEYYESRSTARKDSSELLKMIPIIITGAVAIGAAIAKYNKE